MKRVAVAALLVAIAIVAARPLRPRSSAQLLDAVANRDADAVSRALAAGADPDAVGATKERGGAGVRPLHLAAAAGDRALVRMLISAGADPDARDHAERTPLHAAAERGDPELIRLLVRAGADVNAVDRRGASVLATAPPAVAAELRAAGATESGRRRLWQRSRVLHAARAILGEP